MVRSSNFHIIKLSVFIAAKGFPGKPFASDDSQENKV